MRTKALPSLGYAAGTRRLTTAGLLERHDQALAHHPATLVGATISELHYAA